MSVKISVIVPCYNVEKYIDECINSLINQTLKDIEIILLNDGSTDNTLAILKKYEKLDSRIKVYEHKNMGLGPTRNRGIKIANGEFLAFVDSDDFV
ncbi:TPA: glycosyltransferase family 2 protein, partial [Enterococcus faecium]|nr:glycosyltransferase family 2 protein [Enterococcus faecium]